MRRSIAVCVGRLRPARASAYAFEAGGGGRPRSSAAPSRAGRSWGGLSRQPNARLPRGNSARAGKTGSGVIRDLVEAIRVEGPSPATAVRAAILRDVWLRYARLPSPNAVPRAIKCRMKRAVVIAALLVCSPAVVRGEDRATMSSDDSVRGIFCTSPKDHSDCLEACALRLKEMQRYRACTAACTNLYCPRK